MIQIINYGLANLRSVQKGFEAIGFEASIIDNPKSLDESSHIVLPGVGAFEVAINNLKLGGWIEPITHQVLEKKKPTLGICLGMQLLASKSYENGCYEGLGIIPGEVLSLKGLSSELPVPNVGWSEVQWHPDERMFAGVPPKACFYFVHSYFYRPENPNHGSGRSSFGSSFAAALSKDNVWATQFHPEKSQKAGLALLKNFANWDGSP